MPNRDPRDATFCLYLTAMKDTYNPVCKPNINVTGKVCRLSGMYDTAGFASRMKATVQKRFARAGCFSQRLW